MHDFSSHNNEPKRRPLRRALLASLAVVLLAAGATGVVVFAQPETSNPTEVSAPPEEPTPEPDENPIVLENEKAGDPEWEIKVGSGHDLEGYAGRTSAAPGESMELFVTSAESTFSVDVYRMGYYSGAGARKVWTKEDISGTKQAKPYIDPETNMVEARWKPSVTVRIGKDWTSGVYLARLRMSNGRATFVPFTVRESKSRRAPIVFQSAVTTWQAYNLWGGHSLYAGSDDGARGRADVVSFDRPYSWGNGTADFMGLELPLLQWLEENGYDVGYATNIDMHADEDLLRDRRAFLSLGHDEYWSREMRDQLETASTNGVNLAFFGANAIFRAIRLDFGPDGEFRREVNYRRVSGDPVGEAEPKQATVSWRDPPLLEPEDKLLGGVMYECNPVSGDTKVHQSLDWLFDGTGLKDGDTIKGIVGSEYDRVFAGNRAREQWLLFRGSVRCKGKSSVQDTVFSRFESRAGVFASGTSNFLCVFQGCGAKVPADERVQRLVRNLLDGYLNGIPGTVATPKPFSVGSSVRPAIDDDDDEVRVVRPSGIRPAPTPFRRTTSPGTTPAPTRPPIRTPRRPVIP